MVDFFAPVAKTAGVEVKTYVPTGLPPVLLDVPLFKQAMLNLLLNAQQAMPEGGTVTLQASADDHEVTLQVIDTGKGMPPGGGRTRLPPVLLDPARRHRPRPADDAEDRPGARRRPLRRERAGQGDALHPPPARRRRRRAGGRIACSTARGCPSTEAKVSVLDRGFLFGDGIYEVLRVYSGKPWLEDDHFARLERSLAAVRIEGVDLDRLRRQVHEGIASGGFREAIVYIQITRGVAPRAHAFPADVRPTELLWIKEATDTYGPQRENGVRVSLQPDLRWKRCDIKSVNLLANVLANQAAKEADAVEAILCLDDGTITEASHSSLFGVVDGKIRTTADSPGILPGDDAQVHAGTRSRGSACAVDFRSLHRDDLAGAEELFLTGTSMEVCPVVRVDEQVIADGKPGPVTRRLQAAYREVLAEFRRQGEGETN